MGGPGTLDYSMEVSSKGNLSKVWYTLDGADKIYVNNTGDLVIQTELGNFIEKKPHAYQDKDGKTITVESKFVLKGKNKVGYSIGNYDKSLPLKID